MAYSWYCETLMYKLVQRLGDYWGDYIRMWKTAYKHLPHVVDLYCSLGYMIAGPGDSGKYLNPLPNPPTPYMYVQLIIFPKFLTKKPPQNPANLTGY